MVPVTTLSVSEILRLGTLRSEMRRVMGPAEANHKMCGCSCLTGTSLKLSQVVICLDPSLPISGSNPAPHHGNIFITSPGSQHRSWLMIYCLIPFYTHLWDINDQTVIKPDKQNKDKFWINCRPRHMTVNMSPRARGSWHDPGASNHHPFPSLRWDR